MNRLRVELEAMQAAQERAKPAQAPSMNPEDVERFGADLVEMVQRGAATAIDAAISRFESTAKTLETRVASLETALNGVSKRTDASLEDQFYATLEKLVPDWKQINDDEGFLAWLAEVDPVYGVQRQVGLSAAHQALRADHAANVFNAFKAQRKPRASPSDLAAPRSSGASTELAAPEAPTFVTTKDIQTFYHDVSRGAYKGREAEMMRREQEITQAVAENRVR